MDTEWFKARKKVLKVSDEKLAAAIGRDRTTVTKVINGDVRFDLVFVEGFADILQVSREEILARVGVLPSQSSDDKATDSRPAPVSKAIDVATFEGDEAFATVAIPMIDLAYGMGATYIDSHVEVAVLDFPKVWVETITFSPPELLTWARGRGDSMAPTIHDGDLVLLDRSQRRVTEQDALWAYTVGDMGAIKRLRVKGDRMIILSDNPSVPPDEEMIDLINIVARVVFIGKRS